MSGKNPRQLQSRTLYLLLIKFFKPLIFVVMALVLIFGYFLLIQGPYEQLRKSRQQDLPELKSAIELLKTKKKILDEYPNSVLNLTPADERLLSLVLPNSFDFPSIVIQLTSLADQFGFLTNDIEVTEVKDNGEAAGSPIKKVNVKVKMAGSNYDHFKNFLSALESSIMIFDVNALEFSIKDMTYELDLTSYYYPNP